MKGKVILSLTILLGLCLGCTSEQWVKDYVKSETSALQETLKTYRADEEKRQEELGKGQLALKGQITETQTEISKEQLALKEQIAAVQVSLKATDERLKKLQGSLRILEKGVEGQGESGTPINLRADIEKKLVKLEELEKELASQKEFYMKGYFERNTELESLASRIEDTKHVLDKQVALAIKGHEVLKNFIIEEIRLLRLEHQGYARELEVIKSRLQTIEGAMERKKPTEM
jgi:hypothetical protein